MSAALPNLAPIIAASALIVTLVSMLFAVTLPIGTEREDNRLMVTLIVCVLSFCLAVCFSLVTVVSYLTRGASC